ncbi:hypothetical protein E8E12_001248 [Didymella heteroderae]|uniref:Rho-GAP domain-containing protein n=1 Tax=Didymella heteroderae TaxID=1769908 RepID=A0A9P5C2P6_9PLEO|nr:hypothetical protein E8E12_001248 [Didymella heteroderae]
MFGKCIEHILTNEGQEFRGSLISQPFARTGSEERHVQLKREFEMAPDHGKGIDLNRYALRDCVSVLLEYLATIPELLGRKRATTKRQVPRLRSEKDFAVLLSTLPEPNLELILVAIAFFAAYAELGRAHASLYKNPSLSYLELIHRLAELFYSVVVRPLDSSDRLSIQTLELVLKTPLRFRSIAMMERSKRAQNRNQIPSQPLFRKQVEAPADDEVGQEVCGSQSWSKCATEGEEPEQNSYATDKEACSSDDINVEDYDSEWFDAIEPEQVPSEVQSIQDKEAVDIPKDISQVPHDPSSQTRADLPRKDTATYCLRSGLYQSNPEHFAQLKETLNAPASSYGIDIDWSKYTATDAIDVLFDYLKSLREPLLPIDLSSALRWGSVLSHPLDYRTATFTLLMVNAIYFLRKANGKSPTHAEWDELIRARKKIVLEAEDLPKDLAQAIGEKSTADPKQKDADSASPGMPEDYTHGQLQGHGGASTEDQEDQREQEDDDTDRRGSGDGLQLGHQPNVEDTVSKEDKETQNMPVDNDGFALKEKVKPSERGWSWEPLDFQDTEFNDMVKIRTATEIGGSEDESQSLVVLTPDLHPPPSDAQFEPDSCSIVKSSHDHGVEHLHHDDSNIVKQDATGQSHIQPAVSRSQTPQEPVVAADINGTGWRQFLEGVSSPPTPKLVTKLPHAPLPELSITPVDDAAFIEAPFDDQLHEENLTPRQLGPMEPLPEQDRANHGEANATVRKKRSHRKSGGGWTSHPNHSRPKSVAGESVKSESRKSKDDERKRNTDEGAAETAQKQGHSGKKQQRKKSNGSFRRPEKGFREWLHGVRK